MRYDGNLKGQHGMKERVRRHGQQGLNSRHLSRRWIDLIMKEGGRGEKIRRPSAPHRGGVVDRQVLEETVEVAKKGEGTKQAKYGSENQHYLSTEGAF